MTRAVVITALLVLTLGLARPTGGEQAAGDWREFGGVWTAAGRRITLPAGDGSTAAIVELSGAVVIKAGDEFGRGFRGEVIGFDDGEGVSSGRALWTDQDGNRIYSRLTGETLAGARRVVATITGGTGRYAGLEGEYAFTWQYVLASDGDQIQGRVVDLAGRVRRTSGAR